jgi:hypothetical protein
MALVTLRGLQDLFTESVNPTYKIGDEVELADGRRYVYAKNGAFAQVAGNVYQGPAEDTQFNTMAVQATGALGATTVTVTLGSTAATANMFAEGFLVFSNAGTGYGYSYKIKSNDAADAANTCTFTLYSPLKVAITTSTKADAVQNPYLGVIKAPTTLTAMVCGVAMIATTASYYSWLQTKGPRAVLFESTATSLVNVGSQVIPSTATTGAVDVLNTGTQVVAKPIIGRLMTTGTDGYYKLVNLCIA